MPNTPFRRRPLIEELEPRLLFSADLAPLAFDGTAPAGEQHTLTVPAEFPATAAQQRRELIIVDTGVENHQALIADILDQSGGRPFEIVLLDTRGDGIEQISEILGQHSGLDAVHIISHGGAGFLQLGNHALNADTLNSQAHAVQGWAGALNADADILLYGCDVAAGETGAQFLQTLSQLTGADVAASTDKTGDASLGGNWLLEKHTGRIETAQLAGSSRAAAWQGLLGNELQVNLTSAGDQNTAALARGSQHAVATDAAGNFVVVWSSQNQDGDGYGVYARRFAADGTPLTGEIAVNAQTQKNQEFASVVSDAAGNFTVVWASESADGSGTNIFFRKFDANGNPLTGDIRANATASGDQDNPVIALNRSNGDIVVAWQGSGPGDAEGIFFRRFDASGNALDAVDQLAHAASGDKEQNAAVAMHVDGSFVIAFEDEHPYLYFQRFNADGTTAGSRTQVDTSLSHSTDAAIAMDGSGNFTLVYRETTILSGIWGRSFYADGSSKGSWFNLALDASGSDATSPAIAMAADGAFLVTWQNGGADGLDIFLRRYNADGSANGNASLINSHVAGDQGAASLALRDIDRFVVVWSGRGAADTAGVFAHTFDSRPPDITSNSGGASASTSKAENTTSVTTVTATDPESGPLSFAIVGGPDAAKFSLDSATGVLAFLTPPDYEAPADADANNVYEVIVQARDNAGGTDTQRIRVTITNVDEAPAASNDAYSLQQDTTLSVNAASGLLANDTDPEGGALSVQGVTQPAHGTVSLVPAAITTFANLTNNSAVDTRADWSPDGSKIAFDTDRNSSGKGEIYVMNANGSGLVRLTNNSSDDIQAAWSPDGSKIAWMSDSSGTYDIWVMNADGSSKTKLTTTGAGKVSGQPAWSPDGSRIAFTSNRTGANGYDLYVMNANGSSTVKLTSASGDDAEPVWSPDGSKIAFTSTRDGNTEIYVMNADGSGQTRLTSSSGTDRSPVWSPDGSKIAFASNRTGTYQLYLMDANGANPTQITSATTDVTFPDWSPDGTKLLFTHGNEVKTGSVVFDGAFVYTPQAGYVGTDSFSYTVRDASGLISTATVTLNVTSANTAPTTSPATLAPMAEDSGARLITQAELLANASDVDGDTLSATGLAKTSGGGTLVNNGNGTWSYTPALNDDTSVSFSYTVSDGRGGTAAGSATLDITPVNDAPVAANDSASGNEDTAITGNVLANDTDVEGNTLTALLVSSPAHGALILNANGSFTYTPNANFNGTDSFTYRTSDGSASSGIATVTLTVISVNDAPAGTDKTLTANEDTTYTFSVADFGFSDPNDTPANGFSGVRITTLPAAGTLRLSGNLVAAGDIVSAADITAGNLGFTPAANANGAGYASFTFQVRDDGGTANGGVRQDPSPNTITFNITPVNDAPTAAPHNIYVLLTYGGNLPAATDVDGDAVTFALGTQATHGTATVNADGSFNYTPVLLYIGPDAFTYTVSDGNGGSNTYTVTVNVNSSNSAPSANDDSLTGNEDGTLTGNVLTNDTDPEGNTLTAVLLSGPANGSLSLNPDGSFTYAPNANFHGSDSFTYKAHDGALDSNVASVTLTVTPVNDAPLAMNDVLVTDEDTAHTLNVAANDSDVDGDTLTVVAVTQGANGTVGFSGGSVTYTPNPDFSGGDSFSYTVSDGNGGTATATVNVTVNPVNDAPIFTSAPATLATEGSPYSYAISTLDVDGDPLAISAAALPAWLTLTDHGDGTATLSGTPGLADVGSVSLTLRVSDGGPATEQGFTISVGGLNHAPVAAPLSFSTSEDQAHAGALPGYFDANGDPATYSLATPPGQGWAVVNADGSFTYTPNADYTGNDSFEFTVSDGNGGSNTYLVSVNVTPVNDAPSGADNTVTVAEDGTYTFQPDDFGFADTGDAPADSLLAVQIGTLPAAGTLLFDGTPVLAGQSIDAADIAAGKLRFAPAADASGTAYASFTFQVQDSGGIIDGGIDLAPVARTLTIDVTPVNDAPTAAGMADSTVNEGGAVAVVDLFAAFADAEDADAALTFTIVGNSNPALFDSTLIDGIAGTLTLNYAPGERGTAVITVRATDTSGAWVDSTFTARVNATPALTTGTLHAARGASTRLDAATLQASDADNGAAELTYELTVLPAAGTLTLAGVPLGLGDSFTQADIDSGRLAYLHAGGGGTADSLGFQVSDPGGAQATGTLSIVVSAPVSPPIEAAAPAAPAPATVPNAADTVTAVPETDAGDALGALAPVTPSDDDAPPPASAPADQEAPRYFAYQVSATATPNAGLYGGFAIKLGAHEENALLASFGQPFALLAQDAHALDVLRQTLGNTAFQQQLDSLQDTLRQHFSLDRHTVASALAVSSGLSVGYVLWLLRGGVLLSSLLSSLPAWRLIDPLPILGRLQPREDDGDDDSLEGMLKKSAQQDTPRTPEGATP